MPQSQTSLLSLARVTAVLAIGLVGCNDRAEVDLSAYMPNADKAEASIQDEAAEEESSSAGDSSATSQQDAAIAEIADSVSSEQVPSLKTTETQSVARKKTEQPKLRYVALEEAGAEIKLRSDGLVAEVHLRETAATDAIAKELAGLSKLVKLTINQSEMSEVGWELLSNLGTLQQLDLRGCQVNNKQLQLAVGGMPKLRALRLNGMSGATTVDDFAMKALSGCTDLKALALDHLWIGVDGLKELANNQNLSELYLAGSLVDDEAMAEIAKLKKLKKLRIAATTVSTEGLHKILDLPLEDLDASECSQLTDEAMKVLGQMQSLKRLNLFKVVVSDAGVEHLQRLTELRWLNLDQTPVTDAGLAYLKRMTKMEFLHLGSTGVSDAGIENLRGMEVLDRLIVTRTAVTEAGVKMIEAALPDVSVQLKYVEGQ